MAVLKNGPTENRLQIGETSVHLNRYVSAEAERELGWAIDFWKGAREAIPTKNPRKCRNCEYKENCAAQSESPTTFGQ